MSDTDKTALRSLRWVIGILVGYGIVSLICVGLVIAFAAKKAFAQCEEGAFGCGHEEMHPQYKDWHARPMHHDGKIARDGDCCNGKDCRPVRALQDENGDWKIYIPEFGRYMPVPRDVVDEPDRFHDGRSHACTSTPGPAIPGYFIIYCFSPALQKS